jgi:cellulose biosynthesis protein BcsQ
MSAAARIAVMEGEFEGIDLVEILQVVGIGRQYTGVELRKADRSVFATLFIKAGKVVTAASGETYGKEAFFMLFQHGNEEDRKFFHVFRTETPAELPQPLGNLGNLLMEALERTSTLALPAPQKGGSGVMARPATGALPSAPKSASVDTVPPSAVAEVLARAPAPPSSTRRAPSSAQNQAVSSKSAAQRLPGNDVVAKQEPGRPAAAARSHVSQALGAQPAQAARAGHVPKVSGGGAPRRIVLGIASPKGGSGKTTVALNLSLSFARQGRSVILVDADINGDVLSSIQARERAEHGAFDVLLEKVSARSALLRTVLPNFSILPALGQRLPDPAALAGDHESAWQKLLAQLSEEAELVIVDTQAGMFGETRQVASACTHLLGVLQAELIASRSFSMFQRAVEGMPEQRRPEVVGVVLNMLQSRQSASVHVLADACAGLPRGWLLDTAIPRSDAFLNATEEGLPLRLLDDSNPPAVSWLFDTLASELTDRLGLAVPQRQRRQLLL